jgi:hypothetical protein
VDYDNFVDLHDFLFYVKLLVLICCGESFLKDLPFRVFNATFNNISVISWPSVLLVEETSVPREKH